MTIYTLLFGSIGILGAGFFSSLARSSSNPSSNLTRRFISVILFIAAMVVIGVTYDSYRYSALLGQRVSFQENLINLLILLLTYISSNIFIKHVTKRASRK